MHNHDHHGHQHHHHGAVKGIRIAFFLNFGFTVLEFIGGVLTNSTAILADAVHDLGDCFALGQAWYFEHVSQREGDRRYTYGFKRFALLGALISTLLLIGSSLYVLSEAIPRLLAPEPSDAQGMALLAVLGIVINGYAMLRLMKEPGANARTVGLHLLEDVLGWVAVLLVGITLMFTELNILDPILAIVITLYILYNVVKNLRGILPIFLQAAPEGIDLKELEQQLESLPQVSSTHHGHIWSLDDSHHVFSIHLVCTRSLQADEYMQLKQEVQSLLKSYGIFHSTVEIEFPNETCRIDDE